MDSVIWDVWYRPCIVHVPESPHSWNDALTFGLAFLRKFTKLWRITGCINSCYKNTNHSEIVWFTGKLVLTSESGKSCLTSDFTSMYDVRLEHRHFTQSNQTKQAQNLFYAWLNTKYIVFKDVAYVF